VIPASLNRRTQSLLRRSGKLELLPWFISHGEAGRSGRQGRGLEKVPHEQVFPESPVLNCPGQFLSVRKGPGIHCIFSRPLRSRRGDAEYAGLNIGKPKQPDWRDHSLGGFASSREWVRLEAVDLIQAVSRTEGSFAANDQARGLECSIMDRHPPVSPALNRPRRFISVRNSWPIIRQAGALQTPPRPPGDCAPPRCHRGLPS